MNLKKLRIRKGMSQEELADKAGLTQTALSFIESGKHNPNPKTMKKLSAVFEMSVEEIYDYE